MLKEWEIDLKNERVLLVYDGTSWFVRSVRVIEHDLDRDEKVYRCDRHIAGPLTLEEARDALSALVSRARGGR